MTTRRVVLLGFLALAVGACGGDVTATPEYVAIADERDALDSSLAEAEERASDLRAELEDKEAALEAAIAERDRAVDEVETLRLRYDDEIRAELQAAFDAEAQRACDAAKADLDAAITGIVQYEETWEPVGTRADLADVVTACAAEERARSAAEREAERLAACATVDVDAVVKDPDAFTGDCFVLHAAIWQMDSRTGACNFLAAMSPTSHRYRYQYGEDAAFVSKSETSCPELDGIDTDDHIKVWVTGLGAYRYDTAMGGTNEIPSWMIEKVELVRKE